MNTEVSAPAQADVDVSSLESTQSQKSSLTSSCVVVDDDDAKEEAQPKSGEEESLGHSRTPIVLLEGGNRLMAFGSATLSNNSGWRLTIRLDVVSDNRGQ